MWPLRSGDQQRGFRKFIPQFGQHLQSLFDIFAWRQPHGQKEKGIGLQQSQLLRQLYGLRFEFKESVDIHPVGDDAYGLRRDAEQFAKFQASQFRDDHMRNAFPVRAQQVPRITVVHFVAIARRGPGQVVMPQD